jgi:hypothetical protein
MMRFNSLILVLVSFNCLGFQSETHYGKVKLKNGSKFKTEILNVDADHNVTILVSDSFSVTIPAKEVFKITTQGKRHYEYLPQSNGLYGSVSFGLMFGKSNEVSGLRAGVALNAHIGYKLSEMIGVGLGSGAEFVNELVLAPLYVRFDGTMNKNRVSPIYSVDVGGALAWYQDDGFNNFNKVEGGWLLRPSIGLIFHNLNTSLYFKLNYQVQSITYTSSNDWGWFRDPSYERKEERLMRNMTYSFGIKF